jgi:hypothetical protein
MKKALLVLPILAVLTACSSMSEIPERKTYAQPKWYQKCVESGKEGWFWAEKEYVYACGMGESRYQQLAEKEMDALALANLAKRINSQISANTEITFSEDRKTSKSKTVHTINNVTLNQFVTKESDIFILGGKYYTFTRVKMPKTVYDRLVQESANR